MTMPTSKKCSWKYNMRQCVLLLLVLVFPIVSFGQQPFDYKSAEARIKKHIYSSPDSTKIIINEVLAQKNLPDSIKGLAYNIYGIYYSHIGQLDSSTVQYKKSLRYLKKYPALKTMALGNLSVNYRNMGLYDESFRCLEESLEISRSLGLKEKEAVVYSNMSSNYQFMLEYDKAVEYSLKAIKMLKEANSPLLASTTQKLANVYLKMKNFNFARDLYLDCLAIFKSQNDKANYSLTLINYAEVLIHLGEKAKARKALTEAIAELKKLKNPGHTAIAYSKLGRIAKDEGRMKEALGNYGAAMSILVKTNSLNVVIIGAEYIEALNKEKEYGRALQLIRDVRKLPIFNNANQQDRARFDVAAAETFSKTNNDKEAVAGLERAIKFKDSVARAGADTYSHEMQAKFQAELQNEKNAALKAKNLGLQKDREAERTLMYVYIAISLGLIVIISSYLRSHLLKARLRREALKVAENEKSMLLKQHEHEKELTQAQNEIIAEKQRELASSALKMASYQDNLLQIIERFEKEGIDKISDVKKELEGLVKQKDYWKQFETRFNTLHPEFGTALLNRYSNLTKNDLEFCSLLKLNLSNKEIAQLLQISPESAITKKYRIKKKMEITDDVDFEKVLMGM